MYEFTIALGERNVGVRCEFERTRDFCAGYLTDAPADFWVDITLEDLRFEHKKSMKEAEIEGIPFVVTPPPFLEPLSVYRKIADKMLEYDTLLFHGSVISVDGQGYLFTAASGTGKSTHTRLWRETFGDRAVMVNDDKPLLRITDNGVYVCGTPWNGKHNLGTNVEVPLKGLCILTRAEENHIAPVSFSEALPMLLQQSHRPGNPAEVPHILGLLEKLSKQTGLYRLGCNMNIEAATVAYNGMKG